jgi:DNA invertase Pin-like site-specific DNA recombinase
MSGWIWQAEVPVKGTGAPILVSILKQCEAAVRQEFHRTAGGCPMCLRLFTLQEMLLTCLFSCLIYPFSQPLRRKENHTTVGYARVSSTDQDLSVQLEKLAGCNKVFKEKRSGVDTGRPELKRCLEYLREGDTLLVTKIDRLARSTSDLYRIITELADKGVAFRVVDDPTIDTTNRTGKLVMGILALIAEFENDIRRERQMDGIAKAKERGVQFGRRLELTPEKVAEIKALRQSGRTVPEIIRQTSLSKATVYRALA